MGLYSSSVKSLKIRALGVAWLLICGWGLFKGAQFFPPCPQDPINLWGLLYAALGGMAVFGGLLLILSKNRSATLMKKPMPTASPADCPF